MSKGSIKLMDIVHPLFGIHRFLMRDYEELLAATKKFQDKKIETYDEFKEMKKLPYLQLAKVVAGNLTFTSGLIGSIYAYQHFYK